MHLSLREVGRGALPAGRVGAEAAEPRAPRRRAHLLLHQHLGEVGVETDVVGRDRAVGADAVVEEEELGVRIGAEFQGVVVVDHLQRDNVASLKPGGGLAGVQAQLNPSALRGLHGRVWRESNPEGFALAPVGFLPNQMTTFD